jgi:hypothetical protein
MADFVDSEAEESDVSRTHDFSAIMFKHDSKCNKLDISQQCSIILRYRGIFYEFFCIFRHYAFFIKCPSGSHWIFLFQLQSEVEDELDDHERKKLKKLKNQAFDSEEEEDGKSI